MREKRPTAILRPEMAHSAESHTAEQQELSTLLSGLGERERVEASANLRRVLDILREWDEQDAEGDDS
jgi:hypothetical protein